MKKLLFLLLPALIIACADYTDDFSSINGRLDKLEQALPSIDKQIEDINAQLISLKAIDNDIKTQIAELEKSCNTTAASEITDLKEKHSALEESISNLQQYVDTQIENAKSEAAAAYATIEQYNTIITQLSELRTSTTKLGNDLNAKIDAEIKSLNDKITDLENRLQAVEEKVENLLARIQSVSYIPTYSDSKATVKYTEGESSVSLDFEVSPKDAVAELAKVWQSALSLKAVYTETRTVSFVDMPIMEFEADAENGIISIKASGENLSNEFSVGIQEACARLAISDGNNSVTSEYISLVAGPTIYIAQSELKFVAEGGSQDVAIIANIEYEVSVNDSWATYENTDSGITITVPNYNEMVSRKTDITISNKRYNIYRTLSIVQSGRDTLELVISLARSRTSLGWKTGDVYPLYWSEGDTILCNGMISNSTIITEGYRDIARFIFPKWSEAPYHIVYPAPPTDIVSQKEGCYPVVFQAKQHYKENSFGDGAYPMYALAYDTNLTMRHLAGALRLPIKGEATLSHIILTAETGYLSGIFDLNCETGELFAQEGNVSNQVEVSFGNGLKLSNETESSVYFTLPAGNYGTISVSLFDQNGDSMTIGFTTPIKAGVVREFTGFTYKPNNNQ